MIFFWRDFLRVQLLVAIVAALLVWLGLSKQFAVRWRRRRGKALPQACERS